MAAQRKPDRQAGIHTILSLYNEVTNLTTVVLFTLTGTKNRQESWLLPTERASAVKTRMNGLSCGEKNHD